MPAEIEPPTADVDTALATPVDPMATVMAEFEQLRAEATAKDEEAQQMTAEYEALTVAADAKDEEAKQLSTELADTRAAIADLEGELRTTKAANEDIQRDFALEVRALEAEKAWESKDSVCSVIPSLPGECWN